MKVFVALSAFYDGTILGVYSTMDKALTVVKAESYIGEDREPEDLVREFEVDGDELP